MDSTHKTSAFKPGASLWILPFNSHWVQMVDWHLGFQIKRSHEHKISKEPLLIPTKNFLPTEYLIEMPEDLNKNEWFQMAQKAWQQLEKRDLRLFLPSGWSQEDFKKHWTEENTEDISVLTS